MSQLPATSRHLQLLLKPSTPPVAVSLYLGHRQLILQSIIPAGAAAAAGTGPSCNYSSNALPKPGHKTAAAQPKQTDAT